MYKLTVGDGERQRDMKLKCETCLMFLAAWPF